MFSINNTPGTTYYPCEGVIAVGQVKSILNRQHLKDEFRKIASVNRLRRNPVHNFMPHPETEAPLLEERSYGNRRTPSVIDLGEQGKSDETRQIFGFVVAGSVQMSPDTLMETYLEFTSETGDALSPNLLAVVPAPLRVGVERPAREEKELVEAERWVVEQTGKPSLNWRGLSSESV